VRIFCARREERENGGCHEGKRTIGQKRPDAAPGTLDDILLHSKTYKVDTNGANVALRVRVILRRMNNSAICEKRFDTREHW
jgi:hypothetical protein